MTIRVLVGVLTTLLIFAGSTERIVEMVKPLFLKIKDPNWQVSAKVGFSFVVKLCTGLLYSNITF